MPGIINKPKAWWVIGGLLLLLVAGLAYGLYLLRSPRVALLVDRGGARWIRYPESY